MQGGSNGSRGAEPPNPLTLTTAYNVLMGTLNPTHSLTHSINQIVAVLLLLMLLCQGLSSGLKSVVTQPVYGAQKGGIAGFVTGTRFVYAFVLLRGRLYILSALSVL